MTDTVRCRCCRLLQKWVGGNLCDVCRYHQGAEVNQTAKRHREHEEMLREQLAAVSEWGASADSERKAFCQGMHRALESRDAMINVLRQISDTHRLRRDGSCTCRAPRNCDIPALLDDRLIQQLIRRGDDHDDEQETKERLRAEIRATVDPDEWEALIRGAGAFRERPRRRDVDSA